MAGAELLRLQRPVQIGVTDGGAHLLAAVPVNYMDGIGFEQRAPG